MPSISDLSDDKATTMATKIRCMNPEDISGIYQLYLAVQRTYPVLNIVASIEQFTSQLMLPRLYSPDDWFHPDADIQLVAEEDNRIVAYASGRILQQGDFLLESNTALIQIVLARREHRQQVHQVIKYLLAHFLAFNPREVHAFNSMVSPIFWGQLTGAMSSSWAWIAEALSANGFAPQEISYCLWLDLTNRAIDTPQFPDGFTIEAAQTYVNDYLAGLRSEFNTGYALHHNGEFAGWCGNFYAGAFVEGTNYDYLYTHWFTIAEQFRGQGLGRMLLRYALSQAKRKDTKGALLLTDAKNFIAQDLYFDEGYQLLDTMVWFRYQPGSG